MTLPPLRLILLAPLLPLALIVMLVASLLWLLVEPDADELAAEHYAGLDDEARQIVAALNLSLTPPPPGADVPLAGNNALACVSQGSAEGAGEGRE